MVAANPHGAGASKELPRLLFSLTRGLTSSGTSRLLPIVCSMLRKTGGNVISKILICGEMQVEGEWNGHVKHPQSNPGLCCPARSGDGDRMSHWECVQDSES